MGVSKKVKLSAMIRISGKYIQITRLTSETLIILQNTLEDFY